MYNVIEQTHDKQKILETVRVKQAQRLSAVEGELLELAADGVYSPYSASELLELEQEGFIYDFMTGELEEVT